MNDTNVKYDGMWDYSGSCAPDVSRFHSHTFSVGVFQWVSKSRGNGLKKTAVVKRFKGYSSNPNEVYTKAQEYCDKLNSRSTPL